MAIFTGAGVAIVTPFNDDEERSINYDKLDALLDYHCNNGTDCIATKPATGRKYDCVISKDNYWLGFPHLYYPSNPHFAESFVRKAQEYRRNKKY